MQTQVIEVEASTGDEKRGYGKITAYHFSKEEQMLNAVKKLLMFWGIAVVCVFIPALHFVLVPLFLVLGVYFFIKTIKLTARVTEGETSCPVCQKTIKIEPTLLSWPLTEICQSCVNTVRIRPRES